MKKIFILSILLILSCGYAYGEIIRITNDSNYDYDPIVNAKGHVWWRSKNSQTGIESIKYYNGKEIITVVEEVLDPEGIEFYYLGSEQHDRRSVDDNSCYGSLILMVSHWQKPS